LKFLVGLLSQVFTSIESCLLVATKGMDFESPTPLSTSTACARTLRSSPDSASGRHIVWREMDTVRDALNLEDLKEIVKCCAKLGKIIAKELQVFHSNFFHYPRIFL
jgi:hypothetical protein